MERSTCGTLPTGERVEEFTLTNARGARLRVMTYGGIVTGLHVPDREGALADVVLGLPDLGAYLGGHPWFGAVTGRVAGRISHGTFSLDGKHYELEINNPPNHLHGGSDALDKKNWRAEALTARDGDEPRLRLSYLSPDGECGHPGNVDIRVTYALTRDNAMRIDYEATTDQPAPLCLTNHSYFNLAGEGKGTVEDHIVQIHADGFVPTDDELTLSGRVEPVAGRANDFTSPVRLGDAIGGLLRNHGDNYIIRREEPGGLVPVARVEHPSSGRVLEVESTDTCVQFYTGRFLDEAALTGKSGVTYDRFGGLCLECHGYPDGVNTPEIDDIILRPGQTYRRTTVYRFGTTRG